MKHISLRAPTDLGLLLLTQTNQTQVKTSFGLQEEFSLQLNMVKELNIALVAAMSPFGNQKGNQSDDQINIESWEIHRDLQRSGVCILSKPMLGDHCTSGLLSSRFPYFLSQFDLEF